MCNNKGRLVVLEGLDGTGKSTLIKKLRDILPDVHLTQQPSKGFFDSIPNEVTGEELQDLLDNNRRQSIYGENGIKEYLNNGVDVICDRYIISGTVHEYFEMSDKTTLHEVYNKYKENFGDAFPTLILYLDITPKQAMSRVQARYEQTKQPISRYENIESLQALHKIYDTVLDIIESNGDARIIRIDATKTEDEVLSNVLDILHNL